MTSPTNKGLQLLSRARSCYDALEDFRRERQRNKRYNYGDQWSDIIEIDGRRISEEQYIKEQGSIPLKTNLIRRLVRNVVGVYNSRSSEPICVARDPRLNHAADTMTALLKCNMQLNRMSALYTRSIEEFLISGLVVHRKCCSTRAGRLDCWTDYVQPGNFFVDTRMRDFRGWDCSCVGEIHDVEIADVCRQLAHNASECRQLRLELSRETESADPFFRSASPGLCRIYEVWIKEYRERRGPQGWCLDEVWRYYFLTSSGIVLCSGDSPYAHGSHPYVFKGYPMIDGEIHSFVADVVDQQRYTNRLITLYDWIMRSSSKGVLLVPEDCVPRGCSPYDFAQAWSRYNGVIFYRPSAQGSIPQQVANNSTNIGIKELLDLQLKFFEDISGVNDALMGKTGKVAVSAELFGQRTQNATTTLADVLDTFDEFVRDASVKDMKNILQFYSPEKVKLIAGPDASLTGIADIDFDISLTPSSSTAADRQQSNALLMEIWKSGQISLEQMLRAGSFDFADALL